MKNNIFCPDKIAKEKAAFFYTREIPTKELEYIQNSNKKDLRLLLICSGGETLIDINNLNYKLNKSITIDAVDFNINQLNICFNKLNKIENDYKTGKFEEIFYSYRKLLEQQIKKYMGLDEISNHDVINYATNKNNYEKIKNIIDIVFSNENLIKIFNEDAVKYSLKSTISFSEHFLNLFINGYKLLLNNKNEDILKYQQYENILLGKEINKNIEPLSIKVNYINSDFYHYLVETNQKYDLISCSNINDWMTLEKFNKILNFSYEKLNSNGIFIARRLLGDNELKNNMINIFDKVESSQNYMSDGYISNNFDNIGFYKEVAIGHKMNIKINKVNFENEEETKYYSHQLKELENQKDFIYPLDDDYFYIKHGLNNNSYFDFFNQLGKNHHYIIQNGNKIIGTICLVYKQNYFYICDYKITKEFRGKGITQQIFQNLFKEHIKTSNKFMFINMQNKQKENKGLINKAELIFSIFKVYEKTLYLYEMEFKHFKDFLNKNNLNYDDYIFFSNDEKKDIFIKNKHYQIIHAIKKDNYLKNVKHLEPEDNHNIMFSSFDKLTFTDFDKIKESTAKVVTNIKNTPLISSGEI